MTTKIDGNNGVLQSYDYQVLTTGFSYTFATGITTLIAQPAGTLATGTITMPGSPADGMVITIESTQQVTAVTVQGNSGQTLTGAPSQLIANQPLSFVYRLANTTWYAMAGGAGRATSVVSGTSVASTSGTSIDFTGLPNWVKRVTVMFSGVSTSGTSPVLLQLGSTTIQITGYLSFAQNGTTAGVTTVAGMLLTANQSAAGTHTGNVNVANISSNSWVSSGVVQDIVNANGSIFASSVSLAGVLDRIRITTVNGTDTFDAGTINILYE